MAIVVDTNVVSELMRESTDSHVLRWINGQEESELIFTAVVEAELRIGIAMLPKGRRRSELEIALEETIDIDFNNRVIPFDSDAAHEYATIGANRKASGTPISEMDCQIAAIARSKGAAVATRDVRDFQNCGIEIINPWKYTP